MLCYGLVFFSVIGIMGRILDFLSDDLDSETSKKEYIPLPGFLGKSALEAAVAVAKNPAEEKEIRGARLNRDTRNKMSKSSSKRSAANTTTVSGNSRIVNQLRCLLWLHSFA